MSEAPQNVAHFSMNTFKLHFPKSYIFLKLVVYKQQN